MKIEDKTTFDKANIFGQGEENSAFASILPAILI